LLSDWENKVSKLWAKKKQEKYRGN